MKDLFLKIQEIELICRLHMMQYPYLTMIYSVFFGMGLEILLIRAMLNIFGGVK